MKTSLIFLGVIALYLMIWIPLARFDHDKPFQFTPVESGSSIDIQFNSLDDEGRNATCRGTMIFYPNHEVWILTEEGSVHLGNVVLNTVEL